MPVLTVSPQLGSVGVANVLVLGPAPGCRPPLPTEQPGSSHQPSLLPPRAGPGLFVHSTSVDVRGQLVGVDPLLLWASWGW